MAPSASELKEALVEGTRYVFEAEPEAISVNKVRKHVEEELGLEDGFFAEGKWKQISKTLIKELVDELLEADDAKEETKTKAGKKRHSPKAEPPQPKRQRKSPGAPKKVVVEQKKYDSSSSKLSELDEISEPESDSKEQRRPSAKSKAKVIASAASESSEVETKPKSKKVAARRKAKPVADSDEEPESDPLQTETKPAKTEKRYASNKSKTKTENTAPDEQSSDDEELSDLEEDTDNDGFKMNGPGDTTIGDSVFLVVGGGPPSDPNAEKETQDMEEDEYSDVIDEPPAARGKKKGGSKETSSKTKAPKPAASKKKAAAPAPDDSQEAEIKKLQSQLSKCGIRKFWANEFKPYGNDGRAKIRHLKKMLADVGMDGRFSEAKAREIKETRELLADVEAAQEMNKLWGMNSGERASRSRSTGKPAVAERKADSGSEEEQGDEKNGEEDGDEDDEDDEKPTSFAARRRKAHADLAFLGDDSDSE